MKNPLTIEADEYRRLTRIEDELEAMKRQLREAREEAAACERMGLGGAIFKTRDGLECFVKQLETFDSPPPFYKRPCRTKPGIDTASSQPRTYKLQGFQMHLHCPIYVEEC